MPNERYFYNGREVFSNDGGKTFQINGGQYVQPGNKNLVKADKVGRNAYKVGNDWFRMGTGKKVVFTNNAGVQENVRKWSDFLANKPTEQTTQGITPQNTTSKANPETPKRYNNQTRRPQPRKIINNTTNSQNDTQMNPNYIPGNGQFKVAPGTITTRENQFIFTNPNGVETTVTKEWFPRKTNYSPDLQMNYNRKYVRSQRDNYRDVDSYYDYITNNPTSNDAVLWNRVLGQLDNEDAKRQAFNNIMSTYGIKGNLGRRDSGRLANVLNTIKGIATDDNIRNSYLDSYQGAMEKAASENENIQRIFNRNNSTPWLATPTYIPTNYTDLSSALSSANLFSRFKKGGRLISRNPVKQFLQRGGRFSIIRTGHKPISFNTRAEAEAYRKKHNIVGQIHEQGQEQRESRVLRADNTKSGHTKYGRQQEEAQYNNLSFKQAYNKARNQGKEAFGYKGKVYSTDLGDKATNKNMTRMKNLYGNYLGYQKDPKLQNKQSRAGREAQNRRLNVDDSYKQISEKKQQENQQRQARSESAAKIAQNFTADKLVDALSPWSVALNTAGQGIAALNGEDYNGHLYRTVFNPLGIAQDFVDNNYKGLAERGLDAVGWFGGRPLGKAIDWAGTRFAPRIASISGKSAYLGKRATEPIVTESGEIIGRQPWKGAVNAISGEVIPKGGMATGRNVTAYGTRSVQRAANEGVLEPLAINGGMNNATRYGNAAWRNNNSGLTYVFRNTDGAGNLVRNSYDVAIDNAVKGASPFVATSVPLLRMTGKELLDQ